MSVCKTQMLHLNSPISSITEMEVPRMLDHYLFYTNVLKITVRLTLRSPSECRMTLFLNYLFKE